MSQDARERSMARFKSGKKDVLIATDVAARGIDVDDVTHVVNHTIPEDEKAYLHRVGRTGRAGKTGIAITFVDWDDLHKWSLINKSLEMGIPEPLETYSSSSHLFEDLQIAPGTKGRLNGGDRIDNHATNRVGRSTPKSGSSKGSPESLPKKATSPRTPRKRVRRRRNVS